jgi:hypothetical protein
LNNGKSLYPEFFPEGCPPEDAQPMEIMVYRLIKGESIDNEDFKSFFELGRDARHPTFPFIEYGISINTDYQELKSYWRGSGALKKAYKNIGAGITQKNNGVIKYTPTKQQKSHHTWWLNKAAKPEDYFMIE